MWARLSIVAGLVVGVVVAGLVLGGILALAPEPPPPSTPAPTTAPATSTPLPTASAAAAGRATSASRRLGRAVRRPPSERDAPFHIGEAARPVGPEGRWRRSPGVDVKP